MKIKIILSILVFTVMINVYGQKSTIELTFTAVNDTVYIQIDSIKVMNRTQSEVNMLYWPDTTLTLEITPGDLLLCIGYYTSYPVGLKEINPKNENFTLYQNYPNPVKDQSVVSMFIPEKGMVNVMITDVQGKQIINSYWNLDKGHHSFNFIPGDGSLFFITARWNEVSRSIKMLMSESNFGKQCMLNYMGLSDGKPVLKSTLHQAGFVQESGILDTPESDETYTFEFATKIPCRGIPTVTYEGQVYNTIRIFSQCWLKENLNVGTMIPGTQEMKNNSFLEKYCYNNEPDSCFKYGGLYQWGEMMQYNSQQGVQGICPSGWHLPTNEEWKVLEGSVDSQYRIGDPEWDIPWDFRGFDAGSNLKSTSGWYNNVHNTDLFGFSGLPGGYRFSYPLFHNIRYWGYWWTSTECNFSYVFDRYLGSGYPGVHAFYDPKDAGFSVRCLKDN